MERIDAGENLTRLVRTPRASDLGREPSRWTDRRSTRTPGRRASFLRFEPRGRPVGRRRPCSGPEASVVVRTRGKASSAVRPRSSFRKYPRASSVPVSERADHGRHGRHRRPARRGQARHRRSRRTVGDRGPTCPYRDAFEEYMQHPQDVSLSRSRTRNAPVSRTSRKSWWRGLRVRRRPVASRGGTTTSRSCSSTPVRRNPFRQMNPHRADRQQRWRV